MPCLVLFRPEQRVTVWIVEDVFDRLANEATTASDENDLGHRAALGYLCWS